MPPPSRESLHAPPLTSRKARVLRKSGCRGQLVSNSLAGVLLEQVKSFGAAVATEDCGA